MLFNHIMSPKTQNTNFSDLLPNRPVSITVNAYLLILNVFIAFLAFLFIDLPANLDQRFHFLFPVVVLFGLFFYLMIAIGILGGHNWARLIFLWLTPVVILISNLIFAVPYAIILLNIVWYILFAFFLNKKREIEYFKTQSDSFICSYLKFANTFSEKSGYFVSWLTTAMVLVVCYDVVTRYFLKSSSVAIQELEWHLFAIIFLLGAAYTLKADRHVRVDVLYAKFSPKTQAWVNFLGCLIFLIPFCIMVIISSKNFVANSFKFMETSPDPGGLPARFLLKACIPLGFAMILIQGFSMMLKSLLTIRGISCDAEESNDE